MQTILAPLLGLDSEFPDKVFVLHHPPSRKYGCYNHEGIHGVACFSDEAGAWRFNAEIGLNGMLTQEISFEEAREVAKGRPLPIIALILLDDMSNPRVHFVR